MVPGIVVLIGKVAFLAALYGFLYAVFRGLMAESQRAARSAPAAAPAERPEVERWELRPETTGPAIVRPAVEPPAPTRIGLLGAEPPEQPPSPRVPEEPAESVEAPMQTLPLDEAPPPEPADEPAPQPPEPPPPPKAAGLRVLTSPEAGLAGGQVMDIGDLVTIGRNDDNTLVLKDRFVSGRHAEVFRQGERFVLRDLNSTNGTFRNGARLEGEAVLADGDRIGIGTTVFAFRASA